jgi:ribose/xylose/arabinose/galactoside ABC-type transport system permease subunit
MKLAALIVALGLTFAMVLGTLDLTIGLPAPECRYTSTGQWNEATSESEPGWECVGPSGYVFGAALITIILGGLSVGAYATWAFWQVHLNDNKLAELKERNKHDREIVHGNGRNY